MHGRMPDEPDMDAIAAAREQAKHWHYIAGLRLRDGEFSQARHDDFVTRADRGLSDGLAIGALGRRMRKFRPTPKWPFKRFKSG